MAHQVGIVVVPFPAHGHLNQLLHFSLHLSSHNLPVHFAASAAHNRQARDRIQGWSSASVEKVHFHDLQIPPFCAPPPDPDAAIKFPAHLQSMFEASDHLRSPLLDLFRLLSGTYERLVVVHDPLMSFAGIDAVTLPNVEVYRYQCLSAFFLLSFFHVEGINKLPKEKLSRNAQLILKPFENIITEEFTNFVLRRWIQNPLESGTIINTSRSIEPEFIDLFSELQPKRLFAVGPINPIAAAQESRARHACLDWLDAQPLASVVYVSFGTTSTISDEQIVQLAVALRRSGQRFIWVLRDADVADIFAGEGERRRELPEDFGAETRDVGVVLRGWAPQLDILAHASTGAFVSHCGWNSCMEAMSCGVPVIAWPMHSDQPRNALMVSEVLRVGVEVRGWERRGEVVAAEEIEAAIETVMVKEEGKGMRERAAAVGEAVRAAVMSGGSSRSEFESFVDHITRLRETTTTETATVVTTGNCKSDCIHSEINNFT